MSRFQKDILDIVIMNAIACQSGWVRRLACVLFTGLTLVFSIGIAVGDDNEGQTLDSLFEALSSAENAAAGREHESAIWEYWFDQSPTVDVRISLDAGLERREAYDYEAAESHFDDVIEAAPDYAEGYNQRAFIRFLRENFEASMQDLEAALELEPRHFGAMAGMYQILVRQNRTEAAMGMLRDAVNLHPWLRERAALPEAFWPERYRELREREQGI